ncbi:uncharacterized protein LOC113846309 [Abrus precatorius]|uniref:Uncharacterized protein LOC113846309 n=1 Tax=Abrus precatorius TaxID=3816 RepID=A0A8B8JFH3_ABRPR|nr:uncharacterized protein LOC113846309 [Abrus precatorius]
MSTQIKKKGWSRAKRHAQKKEKCTVFPLVRYNEFRQPVCQVCNVVMESISAHLTSLQHLEVVSNLKANTVGSTPHNNAEPVTDTNYPRANPERPSNSRCQLPECSPELLKRQSPLVLQPGFCAEVDKIKTRSVSKVIKLMDPPEKQESNYKPARKKSKNFTPMGEASRPLKPGIPQEAKPSSFRIKKTSNQLSTPRRSKRIKHVADKTIKNVHEESQSKELMQRPAAENLQADVKEVSSDVDGLVIYQRKRLTQKMASGKTSNSPSLSKQTAPNEPSTAAISSSAVASPPHQIQDPPAAMPANIDATHIKNTNTADPMLSENLFEAVGKFDPPEANAQEQVASSKNQESPDQVYPITDEVSTVNVPLNLEAINKMIEDDPLSALEYILSGNVSFSKTQQSTTQSEPPKVQSSTVDALSKELKDLIQTFSLVNFATDYKQMSKVLFILDELQKNEKFLSLAQQTFIKGFRLFFNNAVVHHKECDIAGIKKIELSQAKENILLKLQEAKHTQEQITTTISNANEKVNEISSYIEELEKQLSKLKKERETFQLAINEGGKQREILKSGSVLWAHQAKDLVFDLAETETQLKTLGEQLEADKDAYVQFKASFPF